MTCSDADADSIQNTPVVVPEPEKGGRLALKGFLTTIVLSIILFLATTDKHARDVVMIVAFGTGAAHIIMNLRKWKQNNAVVRGAAIGWTVALILLLRCVVGIFFEARLFLEAR